ncbi:MAG: hypothetical protein KAI39_02440 [Desulfobulbaceae bacterium]|nr:hypothetical protein [Desulfobulbaceae bacterium]
MFSQMKLLLVGILTLVLVYGCVLPASVKLGDQSMQTQDYLAAIKHYELAMNQTTDSGIRRQIETKLATSQVLLVDEYLQKADQALASGQSTRAASYDRAIVILHQVGQWDDAGQRISARIREYKREKQALVSQLEQLWNECLQLISQFRLEDALQKAEKRLALDSVNTELLEGKLTVLKVTKHHTELKVALNNEELNLAIDAFKTMNDVSPVELKFADLPQRDQFVGLITDKSRILKENDKWWEAYQFLTQWEIPELVTEIQEVQSGGSSYYLELARQEEKSDSYFKGFLLIERAAIMDKQNLAIFNLHRLFSDQVDNSMQSNIAIASFGTPSTDPDAGRQFSDSLISYLYEVFPYGIKILEREKIDFVKEEQGAGEQDLAQMLGVDLMVTGTVSLFQVDKNVDERTATVKVKINEEIDYDKMITLFGPDRSEWPRIESQMPKKSIYESISYKKGQAELKGFAKVSVRIFDTNKGAIAFVKDYEANVSHLSKFQDEVSEANINYVPIKLPTETEAKEEMRKEVVRQIGQVVQASFQNREIRFLNQARFYLERKEWNSVFRPLAEGYVYCQKSGVKEDNPSFVEIRHLIDQLL